MRAGSFSWGSGLSGLVFGLAVLGQGMAPAWLSALMVVLGGLFCWLYALHARRTAFPVLNLQLINVPTFRASVLGGSTFRLGLGASGFLLPLLFQIGFGMTAFASGLLTFVAAVGAFTMKFAAGPILNALGFRTVLIANAVISSIFVATAAFFTPATPHAFILGVLLVGGFFRSLQFTAVNSLAYADIEPPSMSQATSFASAAHQLSLSFGVAIAALVLESAQIIRGDGVIRPEDFTAAFLTVAGIGALSTVIFATLPADAGAELSGRASSTTVSADTLQENPPPERQAAE